MVSGENVRRKKLWLFFSFDIFGFGYIIKLGVKSFNPDVKSGRKRSAKGEKS